MLILQNQRLKIIQAALFIAFLSSQSFILDRNLSLFAQIPPPVEAERIRLPVLGETVIAAKLLEFWLLSFDMAAGRLVKFEDLNYQHLTGWLNTIQNLDPRTDYPSLMASGVFIDVKDKARMRQMIEFVNNNFLQAPLKRWRWQAQAAMLAKYRLHDLSLARRLAANLRQAALASDRGRQVIPAWARDMEALILQDMGEIEAAVAVIDQLLQSGAITDPDELRFLTSRLRELKAEH